MPTLLKVDVSPRGEYSISRKLGQQFAQDWKQSHPEGKIVARDLAVQALPYVDLPWIAGAFSAPDKHTAEHKAALKVSDELIAELQAADEILISTPMYNFNIPAALKAWIDHIVRAGKTFRLSGAGGFEGLLTGKKATVIIASGGAYPLGTPYEGYDQETPYLRAILAFVGLTDVTFVRAGGTNKISSGDVTKEDFLNNFKEEVSSAAAK